LSDRPAACTLLSSFRIPDATTGDQYMVERRIELDRRYMRKKKMAKLKAKLETATGEAREKILYKIKRLSPFWTEPAKEGGKK
jgi:hypothetical protein